MAKALNYQLKHSLILVIIIAIIISGILIYHCFEWKNQYDNHNSRADMKQIAESDYAYLIDPEYWKAMSSSEAFDEEKNIYKVLDDVLTAPGSLAYGPYREEPYSIENRMMLNAYRITEESQKKILSDIITSYKWEYLTEHEEIPLVSDSSQKIGIGVYYSFTAKNEAAIIDIETYDYGTTLLLWMTKVNTPNRYELENHQVYRFLSRDPGLSYRLEYMMKNHEIQDAQKIPYQSKDWEWFFGEM